MSSMHDISEYSSGNVNIADGGQDMYDAGNYIDFGSNTVYYRDNCGQNSAGSQSYQMDIVTNGITVLYVENMVDNDARISGGLGKH